MRAVPSFAVEYLLLGKTGPDTLDRLAQDGGIVSDVWLAFAERPWAPHRVLVAPVRGTTEVDLAADLHKTVLRYRDGNRQTDLKAEAGASPVEQYVAITLYLDELLRLALPLTSWWGDMNLEMLQSDSSRVHTLFEAKLISVLSPASTSPRVPLRPEEEPTADRLRLQRVLDAAPVAALMGLFALAREEPSAMDALGSLDVRNRNHPHEFQRWLQSHAVKIAAAARRELSQPKETALGPLASTSPDAPPCRIHRIFLDRKGGLSVESGTRTIKADAASRLFDISCSSLTWAVIDSGIDSSHEAFLEHGKGAGCRVRRTYDFTRIQRIKSFDLTLDGAGTPERLARIRDRAAELDAAHGRTPSAEYRKLAEEKLALIAAQLDERINPDFSLIEPLLRLGKDDMKAVVSDHGTHVAGIIGADWQVGGKPYLQGVCPDIQLLDLRVIHESDLKATESAVLAAMDFIRYLNEREVTRRPLVCGANISLSIPHDVRNYACGATPVCMAADRLSGSGVVVVAAAGNRGWVEQEMGFGTFVMCSVTDPGNAQEVITVGSTHRQHPHTFGVSFFSSRGPTGDGRVKPDLLAPGEKVRGPLPGNIDGRKNGTSMAAPFVSGAAALLMARYPELIGHPARIKQLLCDSATDLGRERYFQGHGLLDVLRALQAV
jgi:serine protease AprX